MIEELFEALAESGANAGSEELAEILWLAARIEATGSRMPERRSDVHHDGSTPPSGLQSPPPSAAMQPPPAEQFYSAADMTDAPGSAARNVDLIRIRRAASLRDPLSVMRALRPLGRHAGQPGDIDRGELDEELTVRSTIEQGLPVPVMRARRGRWLDLALVVDTHHSMLLWHDLVSELRRVFVQTGIFRDVRTWYLSDTGPHDVPSVARASGEPRSAQEVTDPSGHRLVLVVTDTVAGGWNTSALQNVLRQWSSHGPVALLNVLPRRLWDRGAIRPQPHLITAPKPAAPNASWRLGHPTGSRRRQRHREALNRSIAVPIVEANAESISKLAELVASGGRWIQFPCLTVARSPEDPAEPRPIRPGTSHEPPATVDTILRRFRASASPIAQTLAGYLSAVPLNLPVMNLVRQIMLPESEPGHLAEVALGGLFQPWGRDAHTERTDMDRMPFHFRAGVQEALLGSQRRHEITAVQELVRREMGAYVTQRGSGPAGDFLAARGTAGGDGSRTLASDALPFADQASMPSPVGHPVRQIPAPPEEHPLRYIGRHADFRLREAMGRAVAGGSTLIVLVGEPRTGKTNAVSRALQELPDDWMMWSPSASLTLEQGAPRVRPRTAVILDDLQTYTDFSALGFDFADRQTYGVLPGFPLQDMARILFDLLEDVEQAPVLVVGTITPSAWDILVTTAEGLTGDSKSDRYLRHLIEHAEVIRISPVDATPKRWPGEPAHPRLVMIARADNPVRAGSAIHPAGTGFLLSPRLILTAAHNVAQPARKGTVKARNRRGTVTADGWVDCSILWTHDTHNAALLLAEDDLAEPDTDSHFSTPHWAQLTGSEALSPCHVTGIVLANKDDPHASGHLTGTLHATPSGPDAAYEFWSSTPLPAASGLVGAPVFYEGSFLGFVVAKNARSKLPRLAVTAISTLVNRPGFTDICSQHMRRIPRVFLLPGRPPVRDGDSSSDVPAGHGSLRVYISYAHDNHAHTQQVRALCRLLQAEGFDVRLDQDAAVTPQDWTAWMQQEMREADVILVIASPAYKRRAEDPEAGPSVGVAYEARLLRNELAHGPEDWGRRVLPVLLPGSTFDDLPTLLRPFNTIAIDSITRTGIDELLTRLSDHSPATAPAEQARHLSALADQHWHAGRHADALATADQAIGIYSRLASDNPAAYQPALVYALITQSDRLAMAGTGRFSEALQAAHEAVDTSEWLVRSDPDAQRPALAMALSTLSNRLAENGEREQALAAAQRAVELRRRLADTASPTYQSDLARSLSNLSNRLTDLGRHQEALDAINEAVSLYRHLTETDRDAFLPVLATMLNNQGDALREANRLAEAENAIGQAVFILRPLTRTDPATAIPALANALINLSSVLSQEGRHPDALEIAEEAVVLCRQLAETSPDAARPRLAAALHNLGLRLSEAGRLSEALRAIDEAVAIQRSLAVTNPAVFLPELALSLSAAAWLRTSQRQDLEKSLDESKEAVLIYLQFAAQLPSVSTSGLERTLAVQAATLDELGRSDEAGQIRSQTPSTAPGPQPVLDLSKLVAAARQDPATTDRSVSYAGVKTMQNALVEEDILDAEYANGLYGTATIRAYTAWQRRLGFAGRNADGIPGKRSLILLGQRHGFDVTT